MYKSGLLLIWVLVATSLFGQTPLDSVLYSAYDQSSFESALKELQQAKDLVQHDSDQAKLDYFGFYIADQWNQDSLRDVFFHQAKSSLERNGHWRRYFKLHSRFTWHLSSRGLYDSVIQICVHAKDLAALHGDLVYESRFLRVMSFTFHDLTQYDRGIKKGFEALEVAKKLPPENRDESIAASLIALGINYDDKGVLDSAILIYRMARPLKNIDPLNAFDLENNMGNTFLKKGALDSALKYLSKALIIAHDLKEDYSLSTVYNNLGLIKMKQGQYSEANKLLDSALLYANGSQNLEKLRDTYFSFSELYQETGDYEKSLEFLKKYHRVQDSMVNAKRIQAIDEIQFKLESEKKDRMITESNLKLKNRNLVIAISSTVVVILLLAVVGLVNRRRRQIQESNLKLQEERLRISRDLHDHIGSELTFISSYADREAFVVTNPDDKEKMSTISDASRRAMQQLRDTIWAIKTEEITLARFTAKLSGTLGPYAEKLGFELRISDNQKPIRLSPAQAIALFRVCQEAFSNFVRHAEGSSIHFNFDVSHSMNQLEVTIRDNGKGLSPESQSSSGMGIENMKQRIMDIQGTFSIQSTEGNGCTIQLVIPLSVENKLEA
jgi:signal transduction histidine kinase